MSTSRSRPRVALAHGAYGLLLGVACLVATLPWLVRAWRDRRQLRWVRGRLGALPPDPPPGGPIWIHAVSVGEVKAARPLVAALRRHLPQTPLALSTGTVTGHETARRAFPDLYVFHAPLDARWIVRRVLARLKPRLLLMLELEVWPALLRAADEAGVPQAIVNGRVTSGSYRAYRRFRWWVPEFDRIALALAQDETQAGRIRGLGVPAERVFVTGNLKHELPQAPAAPDRALARACALGQEQPVFLAGSTHEGEDEPVLRAWLAAGGGAACQLVLVPRHLERVPAIQRLLGRLDVPHALRSACPRDRPAGSVLLVDTMGELEALFGLATIVFVGGSLVPVGGHNVLEPAARGRPVLVGPHLESCRMEAELLRAAGALEIVADGSQLGQRLGALLGDPAARQAMGRAARASLERLRGAAEADVAQLRAAGLLDGGTLQPAPQ